MKYFIKAYEDIGDLRTTITSEATSGKSPDEVLESLDRLGIESHVTEEGDLWVRSWQIGAENFVDPEQAAVIRLNRPSLQRGNELDWLSKNLQNIRRQYGGQWVAIYDNVVVAAAPNLPALMNQITEFERPFVTFIPIDPIVWTFTYANERL